MMMERWTRNCNVVPIGSREWRERLRAGQEPDWHNLLPEATKPAFTCKPSTPDAVRRHMREAGRRGGLQRSRNYALRSPRCWPRFCRQYGHSPNGRTAALVKASPEVRRHLRAYASRGGKARAAGLPAERTWHTAQAADATLLWLRCDHCRAVPRR